MDTGPPLGHSVLPLDSALSSLQPADHDYNSTVKHVRHRASKEDGLGSRKAEGAQGCLGPGCTVAKGLFRAREPRKV